MKSRKSLRPVAIAAGPVMLLVLGTVFACSDVSTSVPQADDGWADATTIGVTVSATISALQYPGVSPVETGPRTTTVPIVHGFRGPAGATLNRTGGNRTVIRHFKHGHDSLTTIALRFEKDGATPRFIYVFENGRIQGILSPTYRKHGTGFVRSGGRAVIFDAKGNPAARVDLRETGFGAARRTLQGGVNVALTAASDVLSVFGPKALLASEDANRGCLMEWISYTSKAALLAGAIATLTSTMAACVTGVPCPLVPMAALGVVAATEQWAIAADKLTDCIAKSNNSESFVESQGGGETMNYVPPERVSSTTKTVEQFIDDSIAAGNNVCSDDGNVCTYYAV